jgi:hypothetical protein
LVEHVTENHGVGGSIPPLGTSVESIRDPGQRERLARFDDPGERGEDARLQPRDYRAGRLVQIGAAKTGPMVAAGVHVV